MGMTMRKTAIFLVLVAFAVPCFAIGPTPQTTVGPWWYNQLTFWAPFTDPADALKLYKGTGSLTFTRATTAMRTDITTGYLTSTASGTLRIEQNGALIEGQRTNKSLYSEQLGLAANWVATNVTVDNNTAITDPAGGTAAETLTASGANGTLTQSIATDNSVTHTFSIYLKRKTGTGAVQLNADNTTYSACTINATTWTRCTVSNGLTDNTANHSPGIRIVTDGDAVYAFGGQYEAATFASSYIGPTTTGSATRNADVLTFTASGNINDTVGTVAATFDSEFPSPLSTILQRSTTGSAGGFAVDANRKARIYDGTTTVINPQAGVTKATGTNKAAWRWSDVDDLMVVTINGAAISTGTGAFDGNIANGDPPYIGSANTIYHMWGHIKDFRIWNRAFTDAKLQTITQ